MKLDVVFPTPIWYDDLQILDDELDSIKDFCLYYEKNEPKKIVSNVNGYQSQSLEFKENYPDNLKRLLYSFQDSMIECLRQMESPVTIELSNFWINVNRGTDFNTLHNHPRSSLSGVFYVHAEDSEAYLRFFRTSNEGFLYDQFKVKNHLLDEYVKVTPRSRKLLIFPSWIKHDVMPGKPGSLRISIAFNSNIKNNDNI